MKDETTGYQNNPQHYNNSYRDGGGQNRGQGCWNNNSNKQPICQVCIKIGHSKLVCYHHFDKQFVILVSSQSKGVNTNPQNHHNVGGNVNQNTPHVFATTKSANPFVASSETVTDPKWYVDNGASSHAIAYYNNIVHFSEYGGMEKVIVGNGDKLEISHINWQTSLNY